MHRAFQLSTIYDNSAPAAPGEEKLVKITAPTSVIINTEEPPLDLATFFGNIGGYLTIWGIFGFLFGSGKISPFGFVTEYCFAAKDRESLMNNSGNDGNDGDDLEKANVESESKTLLTRLTEHYVDLEFFSK